MQLAVVEKPETPLYDVEIEQLVLGACLIDNGILDQAAGLCIPSDFYDPLHQRMFATMLELRNRSTPASPLTLKAAMAGDAGLAEVRGYAYLNSIAITASQSSFAADITPYAGIIRDLALRRDGELAMMDARERLRDPSIAAFEAFREVVAIADRAAEIGTLGKGVSNTGIAAMQAVDKAEKVRRGEHRMGAPTGIRVLDDAIGGLCAPDLIVVAGNSGMGKSAAAGVMARAAASVGYQVELFSLEMSAEQLSIRMACEIDYHNSHGHNFPLSYSRIMKGRASDAETDRVMAAAAKLQDLPIRIHGRGSLTMHEISAICRASRSRSKMPCVFIIDHLQRIAVSDRYRGNRVQEITEITGQAKTLAVLTSSPVVLLSQLNRDNQKRPDQRPQLSDLRESGSIEQDADIVLGLYRPAYAHEQKRPALRDKDPNWTTWIADYRACEHQFEIGVLKHRMGEQTKIACYCDMRASVISDPLETAPAEDAGKGLLV